MRSPVGEARVSALRLEDNPTAGSETASIRLLSLGFAVNAYGTCTAPASTTLAHVVCSLPWGVRI